MTDEQICGFYLRAKDANLTFEKINETLKLFATNFICYNVVRDREVNVVESILDVDDKLEGISNELSGIRHALERIADAIETKDALGVSFKVENCFAPSNDEDDEVEEDGWVETDENGRVVEEGDYK